MCAVDEIGSGGYGARGAPPPPAGGVGDAVCGATNAYVDGDGTFDGCPSRGAAGAVAAFASAFGAGRFSSFDCERDIGLLSSSGLDAGASIASSSRG
jgi:hypothetical protein